MPAPTFVLSEPDAGWSAAFEQERVRLVPVLAPWLRAGVVHIGSTSIPRLVAKPVLDMMAGVADLELAGAAIVPLQGLGFLHAPHRVDALHFHRPGVNLHLTEDGSELWRERLAFRDALRADSSLTADYGELKRVLAAAHSDDLAAYTAAKRSFVRGVLRAAGVALTDVKPPLPEGVRVRAALIGQWQALAERVRHLELAAPTRLAGWTNAEVLAHLAVQPALLVRFLGQPDPGRAELRCSANLTGTRALAELIDAAAKDAVAQGRYDLPGSVSRAMPALLDADLGRCITSLQGSITLLDYLRTRCIEAVVHGLDLAPALEPEPAALAVAAETLIDVLTERSPQLAETATSFAEREWVELATGRIPAPGPLAAALPLMG